MPTPRDAAINNKRVLKALGHHETTTYVQKGKVVWLAPTPEKSKEVLGDEPDWSHRGNITKSTSVFASGKKLRVQHGDSERSEFQDAMQQCGYGHYNIIYV